MTSEETWQLCRYVKAACPAQAIDDYTTDVWDEIIPRSYTLDECCQAVIAIKQRQAFIDPSDIIAEVKRRRSHAEDQRHLRTLLDPAAARREIDAADARILAKITARTGRPKPAFAAIDPPRVPARRHHDHPELNLTAEQAAEIDAKRAAALAALEQMNDTPEEG